MRWRAAGTCAAHPQSVAVVLPGGRAVGWRPGESSGGAQGSWFFGGDAGAFRALVLITRPPGLAVL